MTKRIALIDADELATRASFASQHVFYYIFDLDEDSEDWKARYTYKKPAKAYCEGLDNYFIIPCTHYESEKIAIEKLRREVRVLLHDCRCHEHRLFLSGKNNFRYNIATLQPYKAGRRDKGMHFPMLRQLLIEEYFAEVCDGIEADDAMGIYQTKYLQEDNIEPIICSQDKDMLQVEGFHYNPRKRIEFFVTKEEAILNFYIQLITGDDAVDSIPGLKGFGIVKAKKALKNCKTERDMYLRVKQLYLKSDDSMYKGKDIDEVLLEIGQLLWMKRSFNDVWSIPE